MKIPIAIRLIVVTFILLIGVTIPISITTSNITKSKLVDTLEINNIEIAKAKSRELGHIFNGLKDKIVLNGRLLLSLHHSSKNLIDNTDPKNLSVSSNHASLERDFKNSFDLDSFFLGIEVVQVENSKIMGSKYKEKNDKNHFYNQKIAEFLRKSSPIPFGKITDGKGNIIIVNSSYKGYEPTLTFALPLIKDETQNNKITHVVYADVSLSLLQKTISEKDFNLFFITDSDGITLGHMDEDKAIMKENLSQLDIVAYAKQSPMATGMKFVKDKESGKSFYAAFAKTNYGPIVYSLIDEDKILAVTRQLNISIIQILGYFLSITLFLVFVFSMSLTSPLEKLAELIGFVSKGNFNNKATEKVKSIFNDEVKELAVAFDHMTEGLKERDKVKTLFNKFHGSSITEDLMKKDISIGGQTKEVIVFFSDIRGFTSFSENKKPEEVVKMLNEYFAVMVKIINSHGGIVDKFIGDAIMAVWGVPKSTKKDAQNAVKACLEMRRALADLNELRLSRGDSPLLIGMGLHAGSAISGTIGSEERMEYTIIGNTVNTGSRIEAATKAFGSDLLISDTVMSKIGDDFLAEYAGAAEVKGRSEPLKLFKIRGFKATSGEYEIIVTPYSDFEAEKADKVKIAS